MEITEHSDRSVRQPYSRPELTRLSASSAESGKAFYSLSEITTEGTQFGPIS